MLKTVLANNGIGGFLKRHSAEVSGINKQAAEITEKRQIELCPRSAVEHVHIADTIHTEHPGEDVHEVIEGDADHVYGPFLEHGTEKMAAQPHQEPAAQEGRRWRDEQYARLMR